jgi:hypothetical protein
MTKPMRNWYITQLHGYLAWIRRSVMESREILRFPLTSEAWAW